MILNLQNSVSTITEINNAIAAMRTSFGDRKVIGLDCEWKVQYGRHGNQDKIALMQLSYLDNEDQMRVLLIMLYRHSKLPDMLEMLLLDTSIKYVGVNVSGDLLKVGRDFQIVDRIRNKVSSQTVVNLGKYARL